MDIADMERKEIVSEEIMQHASMALGEFAKRAFGEGYSVTDVREMLQSALTIVKNHGG